jgi:hypothetical protein
VADHKRLGLIAAKRVLRRGAGDGRSERCDERQGEQRDP